MELYEQFYQDEDKKFEEKLKCRYNMKMIECFVQCWVLDLWTIFVLALLPLIGNLIFTIFLLFSLRLVSIINMGQKTNFSFIINKTVAESAFSFRVCFWLKSSEAETRRSRVVAEDDLSQKQTRKLKVDEATVLFMINTSRTKFCVLNVAKSEIISHSKLS